MLRLKTVCPSASLLTLVSLLQAALRQITDKAREFGAGPLFNQILPLLMSPTLEDQERHLLVKVIDRILYKLDDLVRPYVHKVGLKGKTVQIYFFSLSCVFRDELTLVFVSRSLW